MREKSVVECILFIMLFDGRIIRWRLTLKYQQYLGLYIDSRTTPLHGIWRVWHSHGIDKYFILIHPNGCEEFHVSHKPCQPFKKDELSVLASVLCPPNLLLTSAVASPFEQS